MTRQNKSRQVKRSRPFYLKPNERVAIVALIDSRPQNLQTFEGLAWTAKVIKVAEIHGVERRGYFYALACGVAAGFGDKTAEKFKVEFENSRS